MIDGVASECLESARAKWKSRCDITADDVRNWFKAAWPNRNTYPDRDACENMARNVRAMQNINRGRQQRIINKSEEKTASDKINAGHVPPKPPHLWRLRRQSRLNDEAIKAAKKGAGVFLKHVSLMANLLERDIQEKSCLLDLARLAAFELTDVEQQVGALQKTLKDVTAARHTLAAALVGVRAWTSAPVERDNAVSLLFDAQALFEYTYERTPKSINDNSPLVQFIEIAMAAIGEERSKTAISKMLKRRRETARRAVVTSTE